MDERNEALWLASPGGPFRVGPAPVVGPAAGEVVVRVRAVALNHVDASSGLVRRIAMPRLRYPAVLGTDVAGEVVEVGSGVTRLRAGDRVVGYAAGQERSRNRAAEGAFQLYVILLEQLCAPIPDVLPYAQAAVLPMGLSTAAASLYERDQLALPLPAVDAPRLGQTVLVWGASGSVGGNAVQLARNSGFDVIATASPGNVGRVESLGAERVFDYRDRTVVEAIVAHLRGRHLAGTIDLGEGSLKTTVAVAARAEGSRRVASAFPGAPRTPAGLLARRRGVQVSGIWGSAPVTSPVGPAVFGAFLSAALGDGSVVAAPAAQVAGHGLDAIPAALARLKSGIPGKLVVTL